MLEMETEIRNVERIVLRYNRLINSSYVFLDTNDKLDGYEIADISSCLIMIYKEIRELIVGEILSDEDVSVSYYVIRETVEYMFDESDDISSQFIDLNLSYDIFLEIVGTVGLVIEYATQEEEYEVSVNLSKFRKEFIEKHYKKCLSK